MNPTPPHRSSEPKESKFMSLVLPAIVGLLFLAGFVGVVWYAVQKGSDETTTGVARLKADATDYKSAPDNPGGMEIPNQDKYVLHQGEEEEVAPLEIARDEVEATSEDLTEATQEMLDAVDETIITVTKNAVEVSDTVMDGSGNAPTTPRAEDAPTSDEPLSSEETQTEDQGVSSTASAQDTQTLSKDQGGRVQTASVTPSSPASSKGDYRVQLLSGRSKDAANRAKSRFEADPVFQGLPFFVEEANLGEKGTYYRLQVGRFDDKSGAESLCAQLRRVNKSCLVVKN